MNLSSEQVLLRQVEAADPRFTDTSMAIYQIRLSPRIELNKYNDLTTKVRTYLNSLHSSYPIYVVHAGRWLVGVADGGTLPNSRIRWQKETILERLRAGRRTIASPNAFNGDEEDDDKAMEDADEKE
ncbi:hypothetical protein BST61_g3810 [Cercospora zeina]